MRIRPELSTASASWTEMSDRELTPIDLISTQVKLLIVNSNEAILPSCVEFERAGYQVVQTQRDLAANLILIMSEKPDLILINLDPPLQNEAMLCRLIKQNPLINRTPILLYSSLDKQDLSKKLAECNAAGYIDKRWESRQIFRKISRCLISSQN